MKYIDAARLKAEIERRRDICKAIFERESDPYYQGKAVSYDETLSFLDTFSEEPDKSFEEALEDYYGNIPDDKDKIDAATYFYKLGQKHHLRDSVKIIDKSVEEEYKDYVENDPVYSKLVNRYAGLGIARHFYELGLHARKEE